MQIWLPLFTLNRGGHVKCISSSDINPTEWYSGLRLCPLGLIFHRCIIKSETPTQLLLSIDLQQRHSTMSEITETKEAQPQVSDDYSKRPAVEEKNADVTLRLLEEYGDQFGPLTPEAEKKLRRKLYLRIMLLLSAINIMLFVSCTLSHDHGSRRSLHVRGLVRAFFSVIPGFSLCRNELINLTTIRSTNQLSGSLPFWVFSRKLESASLSTTTLTPCFMLVSPLLHIPSSSRRYFDDVSFMYMAFNSMNLQATLLSNGLGTTSCRSFHSAATSQ